MHNKLIAYPTDIGLEPFFGVGGWGGSLLKSGHRGADKGWKPDLV